MEQFAKLMVLKPRRFESYNFRYMSTSYESATDRVLDYLKRENLFNIESLDFDKQMEVRTYIEDVLYPLVVDVNSFSD